MSGSRLHAVAMPKWGMTMTEGKVGAWLKAEGERVSAGEEILDVETDKIANAVEAERGGVLARILVREGRTAPCGAPVAVIAEAEAAPEEIDAFLAGLGPVADGGEAAGALAARRVGGLNVVTAPGGDGPPLVLLHGFGSDAAAWMFNQEVLAGPRAVHAVELPSHGASDIRPDLADLPSLAAAVRAAVDEVAPGALHLVGHSLGGRIALALAVSLGERARTLAMIAPAGLGSPVSRGFLDAFLAAGRRRPMRDALRMLVAEPGAITAEMVERSLAHRRIDGVPEALSAVADGALGPGHPTGAGRDLDAASLPILTIWGEADRVIPPPGEAPGRFERISGAGHMPQMERASEVNALLAAHMEAAR